MMSLLEQFECPWVWVLAVQLAGSSCLLARVAGSLPCRECLPTALQHGAELGRLPCTPDEGNLKITKCKKKKTIERLSHTYPSPGNRPGVCTLEPFLLQHCSSLCPNIHSVCKGAKAEKHMCMPGHVVLPGAKNAIFVSKYTNSRPVNIPNSTS